MPETLLHIMDFFLKYLLRGEGNTLLNVAPPQLCLITLIPWKPHEDVSTRQQPSGDDPGPAGLSPFPLTLTDVSPIPSVRWGWHRVLSTGWCRAWWDAHQVVCSAPPVLLFWKAGVTKPGFICIHVIPSTRRSCHGHHPCGQQQDD